MRPNDRLAAQSAPASEKIPKQAGGASPFAGWISRLRGMCRQILDQNSFDLLCRITLLFVVVHPPSRLGFAWYQFVITIFLALWALAYPPLLRKPAFWFGLAALRFVRVNLGDWAYTNNHDWLLTYWCLAIGCSLRLPDPNAALAANGRWMLRLVFIFATAWKLTSPEYLDGRVNEFLLYSDPRFSAMARVLGDFSFDVSGFDAQLLTRMDGLQESIPLREDRWYPVLARMFAYWTIGIEGAIALLLLFPRNHKLAIWGDVALLAFIATTYCWINVFGLAWMLVLMELAQCPLKYRKLRFASLLMLPYAFTFGNSDLKTLIFRLLAQ